MASTVRENVRDNDNIKQQMELLVFSIMRTTTAINKEAGFMKVNSFITMSTYLYSPLQFDDTDMKAILSWTIVAIFFSFECVLE